MKTTQPIKIAIADDHTILRKGVIELINSFGEFRVIFDAVNGKDLIEKIQAAAEKPEICLLDINMPEMNGYETASYLRTNFPNIRILALSMYDHEFSIIKMLRSGANGYILKETDPLELRSALLAIHTKNFYHSEQVSGRLVHIAHDPKKHDYNLSDKEVQFLSLCCTELGYKEIAEQMHLSRRTVEGYRDALFEKLNVRTRSGLVILSIRMGLCPMN